MPPHDAEDPVSERVCSDTMIQLHRHTHVKPRGFPESGSFWGSVWLLWSQPAFEMQPAWDHCRAMFGHPGSGSPTVPKRRASPR